VKFANTDPDMVAFFCAWLRHFFDVDEARLRLSVYLTRAWILKPRRNSGQN